MDINQIKKIIGSNLPKNQLLPDEHFWRSRHCRHDSAPLLAPDSLNAFDRKNNVLQSRHPADLSS